MKAAVYSEYGSPDVLRYVEVPDPKVGADDVLIEVRAISIEGGDLINRRSVQPPQPRHILGYAAAGTVVTIGQNVSTREIGDKVASFGLDGSHAALRAVPANQTWLVPENVDWAHAAFCPAAMTSAHPHSRRQP